jgi:hypothetical protein
VKKTISFNPLPQLMLFFLLIGSGCSPKIKTNITQILPPLDYYEKVIVLGISEEVPILASEIGNIKISGNELSAYCEFQSIIELAKLEAVKAGGNVLKLTDHTSPTALGNACHKIAAKILKVENKEAFNTLMLNQEEKIDTSWNYAKLYVYRPGGVGALMGYDLYLGDSVICRVKNNSIQQLEVTKKGLISLWAKTEAKAEIPIDIEFGREYYLRCSMEMGIMVGRPVLQLVDRNLGKVEYNSIKER